MLALVEHLDAGPAVLIGSSMGASATVWAAATRPDLVAGLVLVSPFLTGGGRVADLAVKAGFAVLFGGPWGPGVWGRYYAGPLNRGRHAAWLTEHVTAVVEGLRRPGRMRALQRFLDHVQGHDRVWVARRIDIARHWQATHPFDPATAFVWE